jgi:excisionase family DNA binding protein
MSNETSNLEILTIKEVSSYLKVTERTVYRLAAAKKIPGFKVGGAWRFSRSEIDQWIRRQSVGSNLTIKTNKMEESNDN